jgi:hypothetical protein
VFSNIQNPYNQYCCALYPQVKECQPIPIPCVNDYCIEQKEEAAFSEDYFNKDGYLPLNPRMKKIIHHHAHNHSHYNHKNKHH